MLTYQLPKSLGQLQAKKGNWHRKVMNIAKIVKNARK